MRSWRLHRRTDLSEADLARWINPVVRGWMNYYGAFYRSALYPLLARINAYLMRWLRKKHKRLRGRKKAQDAWERAVKQRPRYFAHWAWVTWPFPPSGDQNDKSRITGDCYVRFRESRRVKLPPATRQPRPRHATWVYSWMKPPRRSRRRTRMLLISTGGWRRPAGGSCGSDRCGRCPL